MKIVTQNNNSIAIGMSWARLSGEKPQAELVGLSIEVGKRNGFIRKILSEDGSKSYQAALISGSECKGLISGAAALADKYSDLLYVDLIADNLVWICAISGNEVLAGGDKLVPTHDFVSSYDDLLASFGSTDELKIVFSQSAIDALSLDVDDADEVVDFDGLISAVGVTKFQKEFSRYKISVIKAGSNTFLLFGAAISVCLMAYHFAGPGFGSNPQPVVVFPDEALDQNSIMVKKNAENAEKEAKERAYAEEVDWIASDILKYNSSRIAKRAYALYRLTPHYVNGWAAQQFIYSSKNKDFLQILWKKDVGGTPLTLRDSGLSVSRFNFDVSGKSAITYHDIIETNDVGQESVIELINGNGYSYEMLMHDISSSTGVVWKIAQYSPGDRPTPIEGIENKKEALNRILNIEGKTVSLNGTGENDYLAIISILEIAKAFKINKITINLDEGYKWSIDGDLYESIK
jgi:hypothetical protein